VLRLHLLGREISLYKAALLPFAKKVTPKLPPGCASCWTKEKMQRDFLGNMSTAVIIFRFLLHFFWSKDASSATAGLRKKWKVSF